jgi:hypothetical protein
MPDREYTLEIAPGLPDQRGRPLAAGFRHAFRTAGHDREQPRIASWELALPTANTREPLTVGFPEPLDHALAEGVITVETATGQPVAGSATVDADGRRWTFIPRSRWSAGDHRLSAGGELEDLAGNSLYRPFETVSGQGPRPTATPPAFERSFRVEASAR